MKQSKSQTPSFSNSAFTIVEVLIVVVIVAILAAVSIVGYSGISERAKESSVKAELSQVAKKIELYKVRNDSYPIGPAPEVLREINHSASSSGENISYLLHDEGYCLRYNNSGRVFSYYSNLGESLEGDCSESLLSSTMQGFTRNQCNFLELFTGSNLDAIVSLQDTRGASPSQYKSYPVGRLADGKCWMLGNLMLGSSVGPISLTPEDTDIASNLTLPATVAVSVGSSYDDPRIVDAAPSEPREGFFYNWPAATAGENRTSSPLGSANATYSICPSGWKLPAGKESGDFAWLNAKMQNPSATAPSTQSSSGYYLNWQPSGPFRTIFTGYHLAGAVHNKGTVTHFWTSSSSGTTVDDASRISVYAPYTSFLGDSFRAYGFSVRCLVR